MEKRDYLQVQIEQISLLLQKIFSRFLGLNSAANNNIAIEETVQTLVNELDIDINILRKSSSAEIKKYLLDRNFSAVHFEKLALLIVGIGKSKIKSDSTSAFEYFNTSIKLLDLVNELNQTFSLDRMNTINKIKSLMK